METLLINIQDVRKLTNLSKNVTTQKYKQYIVSAQNIQLRDIIGVDCLNELQTAKCSNTLDQYQTALIDIIKPYLINYSYAKYVYSSPLISTEEGIVKMTGDNILHLTDQEKRGNNIFTRVMQKVTISKLLNFLKVMLLITLVTILTGSAIVVIIHQVVNPFLTKYL